MTYIVTQWRSAFYEKCEMQTFSQVVTDIDTEYCSLGEKHLMCIVNDKIMQPFMDTMDVVVC